MIGYHDAGQAVVELMKEGGILGILMYVGVLALFSVLVIVGNAVVLEVSMAGMGIGVYVAAGCSVVGLLATFVLYDR